MPAVSVPLVLIASVVVVSVVAWIFAPLKRALVLIPFRVGQRFEVYRLLTAGWVHGDVAHLVFNVLTLYFFAVETARALGDVRFLVLYLSAVVVSYLPTTLMHLKDPRYVSLGASGAVAAVMFSAILLYPKMKLALMFLPIPVPGYVFALAYLAYSAWRSYRGGSHVNHSAHFYGAAYGALLTYIFEPARVAQSIRSFF